MWSETRAKMLPPAICDIDAVRRAIPILCHPGELHELRALPSGRGQIICSDNLDAACAAVQAVCDQQVYYSLNPVHIGAPRAKVSTVSGRVWFLVDIDPIRPRDLSATDAEKDAAGEVMNSVLGYLADLGWPMPVLVDSGNGFHLLYRVDLANDPWTRQILKGCLQHLIARFNTAQAEIDDAVHDAPRIAKLPGTWARKGLATLDRPHRLCQLIVVPPEIHTVSTNKLQAISQGPVKKKPLEPTGHVEANHGELTKYVQSAIEREVYRVASATEGNRNNALNQAAFALGTMAAWPEMNGQAARAQLIRDGEHRGLSPRECLATVNSGWNAGEAHPRTRPLDPPGLRNGKHEPAEVIERLIVFGNEVTSKKITWVWENRIAPGFISIFAGKSGIGKSFVLCDITARLTTGRALPEEPTTEPPCGVLFISEDPVEYVLVPRLMELKADLSRTAFMTWDAMDAYTLGDKETIHRAYEQAKRPRLVIFDPPGNFLGGKDEHKNAEVRSVVMKLVSWLDEHQVAAVFVTHINRRLEKGVEALDRIMGSVAWGTTARIALGFAVDPNTADQCVCAGIKNNLGPKAPTLGYQIVKTDALATVEWKGLVDVSAEEALGKVKRVSRAVRAGDWLTLRFREQRCWPSDDLYTLGRSEGVSRSAIWEAAECLPLLREQVSPQDGGKRYWQWTAKPGWPLDEPGNSSTVDAS